MYEFTVNIGKEGRQALWQLEFAWDKDHPKQHISKLKDCVNLQSLYIGLIRMGMSRLSNRQDIWDWEDHGECTWKLLRQLPRDFELKIREVGTYRREAQISPFSKVTNPVADHYTHLTLHTWTQRGSIMVL